MCKFFKFLYRLIPGRNFQFFLIKKHFSGCYRCQKEIEINDLLKEIIVIPEWIKAEKSLWPQIKPVLYTPEEKVLKIKRKYEVSFFKKWRWAIAGLALVIVMGLSLMVHQNFLKESLSKEKPRIEITYAEIKGKKAKPYIYQTPNMSFIWFAKTKDNGG